MKIKSSNLFFFQVFASLHVSSNHYRLLGRGYDADFGLLIVRSEIYKGSVTN